MKNLKIKVLYYLFGSFILAVGIALAIISDFGAASFDAMSYNLSQLIGLSIGPSMYIAFILVFITIMILKPRKVYVIGFLMTFIISLQLDLFVKIIPNYDNMIIRIAYFVLAVIFLPFGVAFIIKSQLPIGPIDNLLLILTEKTKWSIVLVKTFIETSFAILALIFGFSAGIGFGAISIGTLIMTFTIGPGIGFFMKYIKDIKI